jgi:hypothetical protein
MSDAKTTILSPYSQRRIALAKLLAASMMGLRKDATGSDLPEDLWRQMLSKADATFFIVSDTDRAEAGAKLESGIDGARYHGPG